jgi:undecaprenyl-diphosphatase
MIFGIVEGVTEWLPISSTGHMILLDGLMPLGGGEEFYELFSVVIQLGAILAVAVSWRRRLIPVGKGRDERRSTYRLWGLILLGVLPSAVTGLLLDDLLEKYLYGHITVAVTLIVYGVAFIAVERYKRNKQGRYASAEELTPQGALLTGFFQTLALIPGTSRSGATILGAYLCGATREGATEFSFLLALPTMLGAGLLKAVKFILEGNSLSFTEWGILAIGTATAFFTSLIVIGVLTGFVRRHGFTGFGIYRIILGAVVLVYYFLIR